MFMKNYFALAMVALFATAVCFVAVMLTSSPVFLILEIVSGAAFMGCIAKEAQNFTKSAYTP